MINRYNSRAIIQNSNELYKELLDNRNLKKINQYTTPYFYYPSEEEYYTINSIDHIWSVGDRFYKLAAKYYGDPKDWWIIARFNKKPTESHVKIGEIIYIPVPIHDAINLLKVQ